MTARFLSDEARDSFGRAVVAASRPDLCTICLRPKAAADCRSGQHSARATQGEKPDG
jgi:hypothetical protein